MTQVEQSMTNNQMVQKKESYAEHFEWYDTKERTIIYVLWQIHNKELRLGSKLFFEPLEEKLGLRKAQWPLVKEFLSGAGLLVDQVVIAEAIPKNLKERYGILDA
ncbi:hypothetical protein [Enterococcus mundtii]|uniref:hypothetical protein n=1 Tax=Enterococcus mundtii TaxID=53346 RepID=UPI00403D4A6A